MLIFMVLKLIINELKPLFSKL